MQLKDMFDKYWWKQRLSDHLVSPVHSIYYGNNGINLLDQEWDNLIILDACRADLFEDVVTISDYDKYCRVKSLGSFTGEWARRSFADRSYGDAVYVTANPYSSRHAAGHVHKVIDVWQKSFDDSLGTVPVEAIVNSTIETSRSFEHKRIIAHFMQPHHPFVTDEKLADVTEWNIRKAADRAVGDSRPHGPFEAVEMGIVSEERAWEGYRENLEYVLEGVGTLLDELDGTTVITSDHGNLIGERVWPIPMRMYGHPSGLRSPELVTVPYAVKAGERREVVDEGISSNSGADGEEITNRLRALGYKE